MSKKIIAVVGATGKQGGAVVDALLANGEFSVRALTRNTASPNAQALAARGCDLAEADYDDVNSLTKAFTGAYGAYFVTDFYTHHSAERELQQTKNLADAAKAAGVQHVVNSTFEDTRDYIAQDETRFSKIGKYWVPHWDGKGEGARYVKDKVPTTNYYTCAYFENFLGGLAPRAGPDGTLAIAFPYGTDSEPKNLLCLASVSDLGKVGASFFKNPEYIGKDFFFATEKRSPGEFFTEMGKILGTDIKFANVPLSVFSTWFPGAQDVGNMFMYTSLYQDFSERRVVEDTKKLIGTPVSWEQWVADNKGNFNLE